MGTENEEETECQAESARQTGKGTASPYPGVSEVGRSSQGLWYFADEGGLTDEMAIEWLVGE